MTRPLLLLGALALLASAPKAQTCTTEWTAASGDWADNANWSNGAPGGSDVACITRNGTYTVSLGSGTASVQSLVLGGTSGAQTLALSRDISIAQTAEIRARGQLDWTSGYINSGAVTNEGLVRLSGTTNSRGFRGGTTTFTNNGTVEHSGSGIFYVYAGATAVNASTWTASGSASILGFSGVGTFRNTGTFIREGDGITRFAGGGNIVENTGTFDVRGGEVRFERPSTHTDAEFAVASGALLRFTAGGLRFEGTITGSPTGTVQIEDSFTVADGTVWNLGGTGMTWISNYMNEGELTNTGLVRLIGTTNSRGVRNAGTMFTNTGEIEHTDSGLFYVYSSATAVNAATWTSSGTASILGFSGLGTFRNTGTFVREGEGATRFAGGGTVVENTGTIDVRGGEVRFERPSTHTNATFVVASGALLRFSTGGVRFEGTTTGNPVGTLQLDDDFTVASGAVWDIGGTGLTWTSNYMNEGELTNRGVVRLIGTTNSRGVRNAGTAFTNEGTIEHTDSGFFYVYADATALNTSLWQLSDTASILGFSGAGTFRNTGTVRREGEGATRFAGGGTVVENTGTIDVRGGEVRFERPSTHTNATFVVASGALLRFSTGGVRFEGTTTGNPVGTLQLDDDFTVASGAVWDIGGTGLTWTSNYMNEGELTNRGVVRLIGTTNSRGVRNAGTTFTNEGTVEHSETGLFYVYATATVTNQSLWDVTGGGDLLGFSGTGLFINDGGATFRKTGDTENTTRIAGGAFLFENRGRVEAQVGEIQFQRPSSHIRAELTAASGAQITFATPPTISGLVSGTPAGRVVATTGILADNGRLNFGGTGFEWSGGYLDSGTLTNQGLLRLTGATNSRGARGEDARFRNEGTVEHSGTGLFYLYNSAIATNAGTWDVSEGGDILGFSGVGTFRNAAGAAFIARGDNTRFAGGALVVENAGTLEIASGTTVQVQRPFAHLEGAEIVGEGTLSPGTQFVLAGGILPGASPGVLTWGGVYAPEASGVLEIEIGGTDADAFDQLDVTGAARANGRLDVSLLASYTPTDGDTFPIVTSSSFSGGFEFSGLVNTAADLSFYPNVDAMTLTLTAFTGIQTASGALALAPSQAEADQVVSIAITGTGFAPDLSLSLECVECLNPEQAGTVPGLVQALTPTSMTAVFDLPFEAVGRYDVVVTDPRGGSARGRFDILPGDLAVEIEVVDANASEENTNRGAFVVRSNARVFTPLDVRVEISGTATRFVDYTTNVTRTTVRIPSGRSSTRFVVLPLADAETEGDETVTLTIVDDDAEYEVGDMGSATLTITDGPPPTALNIFSALPRRAGAGPVTLRIAGQAIADGATAQLTCGGTVFASTNANANAEGTLLTAQFNLAQQEPGVCDLAVTSGGETVTRAGAFNVQAARRPNLSLELISPERRRGGRSVRHRVVVNNSGNTDAYMVPVDIFVNGGASINPEFPVDTPDVPSFENLPAFPGWDNVPLQLEVDGRQLLSVVLPVVPAGSEIELTFMSNASTLSAAVRTPMLVDFALGDAVGQLAPEYVDELVALIEAEGRSGSVAECWARKLGFAVVSALGSRITGVAGCIVSAGNAIAALANQVATAYSGDATTLSYQRTGTVYASALVNCLNAAGAAIPWSAPFVIGINVASAAYDAYYDCPKKPKETETEEVTSFDPNDKLGPGGVGDARYVRGDEGRVYYTVRFENLDTATAPAAEVFVTDTLDVSVFDPASFQINSVTFGEQTVTAPPGLSSWNTQVDLRPANPILLQISGSIDEDGLISWSFVSLDPATLDLPEDPLIGFLPPNVSAPEGEGSVSFSVALRDGLADGTEIANEARIVFDLNEPIDTPVWSNTVDRRAPTSSVTSISYSTASDSTLVLNLQGSDDGSGILSYDIYASRDGGPFVFAFTADSNAPEFEAERGSLYSFFSIARDRVDNLEDPKTEGEATTRWPVDNETTDSSLPDAISLAAPYPNPARGSAVLQFGLPSATRVDLRVYDIQGREVVQLASGEHAAGWHRLPWDTARLAPGVYLVRFQADGEAYTERVTVVR